MKNIKGETFKTGSKNPTRRAAIAVASAFAEKYSTGLKIILTSTGEGLLTEQPVESLTMYREERK